MNSIRQRCYSILAITSLFLLGFGLGPAVADESSDTSEATVRMTYGGFDEEVAAANGYDIRVDDRGVKYSIRASTPKGITKGAKYIPGQEPSHEGQVQPYDTTFGDCGTATLTGNGKSFYTAYAVTDPWAGTPVSHMWRVAVSSSQGYHVYNLDGLAPIFSNSWSTTRNIAFRGWPYSGVVSYGKVSTSFGFACYAYNPGDIWYGE